MWSKWHVESDSYNHHKVMQKLKWKNFFLPSNKSALDYIISCFHVSFCRLRKSWTIQTSIFCLTKVYWWIFTDFFDFRISRFFFRRAKALTIISLAMLMLQLLVVIRTDEILWFDFGIRFVPGYFTLFHKEIGIHNGQQNAAKFKLAAWA